MPSTLSKPIWSRRLFNLPHAQPAYSLPFNTASLRCSLRLANSKKPTQEAFSYLLPTLTAIVLFDAVMHDDYRARSPERERGRDHHATPHRPKGFEDRQDNDNYQSRQGKDMTRVLGGD